MPSNPLAVLDIDHIVLNCIDIDATISWYVDMLGLVPVRVDEWRAGSAPFPSVRVNSHTIIDFFDGDTSGGRLDHFCLVIAPTNLDELARSGRFDVLDGPGPRFGARGDGVSLYVRDPDGTTVELRYYVTEAAWLPAGFVHPARVELATGHHLRPIRESDVHIDYPAVMGSRESLWARYGEAWGWPPSTMTLEQDRDDLARHEREIAAHQTFNDAVLDAEETELLGCVYIDPPDERSPGTTDATTSWWVVDSHAAGPLDTALAEFVPRWLTDTWGFTSVLIQP